MPMTRPAPISARNPDVRYDWHRFWVDQTGTLDLSDAGFLRDPVANPLGAGGLHPLAELDTYPALALLGEPGIGKSIALWLEHERLSGLAAQQNAVSAYVDLNVSSSEDGLYRRVFETPTVRSWRAGEGHLYLHLDSLDEAMLRVETIAQLLGEGFRSLSPARLSVRIACRTAIWPAVTLGRTLGAIWGEAGFGVFELAPLRRRDVMAALSAHGIEVEAFLPKLFSAHAVPFAIKPLTLKMLISLYERHGKLPSSTADLYRQGCLALCEVQNESRRETGRLGGLNARQRLRLAGRIAAATILGRRWAVWTGRETDAPAEDVLVAVLAGAREVGEFAAYTATDDDIREVLDTGLFSSRGDNRMSWAHQTYGEFLAALYLAEKGVPPASILKALTHPSGGLTPPLAIVGAWAASLSSELRVSLIDTDPWTLLRGDLLTWDAADLAALTISLLSYVEQGRFYEYFFGITETYQNLNHPNIAHQLRICISDRGLKPITRHMACAIAEQCKLNELQSDLLHPALDVTEDPMVRAAAIAALRRCGDDTAPASVLGLLRGTIGPDPHTEIRGYALDLLWPTHVSADELFSLLTPSDEQFHGAYARFLFELPVTLKTKDLAPALTWATACIVRHNHMGAFREMMLADAIMFRAWEVFEEPALTAPFLANVAARLHQYGNLCRGTDARAAASFAESLRTGVARRHRFVLLLCAQDIDQLAAHSFRRAGFVEDDDLAWLLDISPGGSSPITALNEKSILCFISQVFNLTDSAQFETLYPVIERWALLRAQFAFLTEGIPIDSEEAVRARELQKQIKEHGERRPPSVVADLPAEIERLLTRAEHGEWRAWWHLNLTLMLISGNWGSIDELNYFITTMPGWEAGSKILRQRIVATAECYLIDAETSADNWLGKQPMSLHRNDLAAMRAFLLLREVAPDGYGRISITIWEKWTPVIVGLPHKGINGSSHALGDLVCDALTKAPHEFVATVRKMLRIEKERTRASSSAAAPIARTSFSILRDLKGCWNDAGLKTALFNELQAADIRPEEYAALLDALLEAGFEPAAEHGLARLTTLDQNTLPVVDVMLRRASTRAWPVLWGKLLADEDAARTVLTHAAGSFHLSPPFYAQIGEDAIADLYLLMERLFPPEEDPKPPSGYVSPFDMIPSLRDGAPRYLARLGSVDAVRALRRLVAERPGTPLLPYELSRAELTMRLKAWAPLAIREIFALTDRPNAQLVTSPADLLDILLA